MSLHCTGSSPTTLNLVAVSTADLAKARTLSAAFVDSAFNRSQQSAAETALQLEHAIGSARGARRAALRLLTTTASTHEAL